VRSAFAFQFAKFADAGSETFLPSQFAQADSSTMRMETGSFEIGQRRFFPIVAGNEMSLACRFQGQRFATSLNRFCASFIKIGQANYTLGPRNETVNIRELSSSVQRRANADYVT